MNRSPALTFAAGCVLAVATLQAGAEDGASAATTTPTLTSTAEAAAPARRWSAGAEVDSHAYRMSLSRGKLDLGVGFDTLPRAATSTARSVDPSAPFVPTLPSLSVGLRSSTAGPPPSSLIERATGGATEALSSHRVGLEWKPVQSRVFVRGGLGVRLTGDDRVTMKMRGGRVGLYMKSTF